jgi:hypothetical protein
MSVKDILVMHQSRIESELRLSRDARTKRSWPGIAAIRDGESMQYYFFSAQNLRGGRKPVKKWF